MERRILIPVAAAEFAMAGEGESEQEAPTNHEGEALVGFFLAAFTWTMFLISTEINLIQYLFAMLADEVSNSGGVVNLFAVVGVGFTVQRVPWIDLFEYICLLHFRLLVLFPIVATGSLLKCLVDITHSYWCVFAPHSAQLNPSYEWNDHPMERK